jgi:hypothetical protein
MEFSAFVLGVSAVAFLFLHQTELAGKISRPGVIGPDRSGRFMADSTAHVFGFSV